MLEKGSELKNILSILSLMVILGIICLPGMIDVIRYGIYAEMIDAFILITSFFLLPYFIFFKTLRLYYSLLFAIALFTPLELLSLRYFQTPISIDMLGALRDTNLHEAKDFLKMLSLQLSLSYSALLIIFYLSFSRLPKEISLKKGILVSLFALVVFLSFSFKLYRSSKNADSKPFAECIWVQLQNYEPFRLARNAHEVFWAEAKLFDNYTETVNSFKYRAIQSRKCSGRQIFVLCIGESSRYGNWGINGYYRSTSPMLSQRKDLYIFPDVAAAAVTTRSSIPMILTRADPDNFNLHLREPGFMRAMKECGFKTYWISAQEKYSISAKMASIHSVDADNISFYGINDTTPFFDRDLRLLAKLKTIIENDPHDLCIVLHMNGSHNDYDTHCDKKFMKFRPLASDSIVDYMMGDTHINALINSYDNTILQSDAILDSVITLIDKQHAISSVLFISDHGENLFDDHSHRILHGGIPTIYTVHVPMFLWLSSRYRQENRGQTENIEYNCKKPLSMTNIFHTSLDLFNIKAIGMDSSKSFANSALNVSKRKVLGPQGKVYTYEDDIIK